MPHLLEIQSDVDDRLRPPFSLNSREKNNFSAKTVDSFSSSLPAYHFPLLLECPLT